MIEGFDTYGATPRLFDNSQLVRQVDPRSRRDFWWRILLVAVFIGGLYLYAWPHFEARRVDLEIVAMHAERDRLTDENRKLRLEKAALENLRRIEVIATRELGLKPPAPERIIVVERAPAANGARVADHRLDDSPERN
jgi:cell division protein FtsL